MRASHYNAVVATLMADDIIIALARDITDVALVTYPDGIPTYEFMIAASNEYNRRGGLALTHMGGPAEAIVALRRRWNEAR